MLSWPSKDPNEVLDYTLDWADDDTPALVAGETIVTFTPSVVEGNVVIDSSSQAGGVTTVWLSGGTAGTACKILHRVTTSAGRTYDVTARLRIKDH